MVYNGINYAEKYYGSNKRDYPCYFNPVGITKYINNLKNIKLTQELFLEKENLIEHDPNAIKIIDIKQNEPDRWKEMSSIKFGV